MRTMDHCCAHQSKHRNVFVMDDSHVRRIGPISPPYSVRIFAACIQKLDLYEQHSFCKSCRLHSAGDLDWLHLKSVTSTSRYLHYVTIYNRLTKHVMFQGCALDVRRTGANMVEARSYYHSPCDSIEW
jgi:hypothetical protein